MAIKWDNAWNTGIPVIDQQHRKLVNIMNDLSEAMRVGKSRDVLSDVLTVLIDYTKTHFSTEEKLMARADYSDIDEHKEIHHEFINKIDEFDKKVKSGSTLVSIDMMNFLSSWVIKHIRGTDSKYVPALKGKV